ncbi:MAG: 1-acyl-sn-glycerol-3-phosphate acyltransferase, partial [Kiritimatiellaeota bacterium]|nr:1-acyl-sn-glycerol-3-phosphate acyltransferase [Kiritimatiellota bacterium]
MNRQQKIYKSVFTITYYILRLFYKFEYRGRENIPEGAAVICANHSKWLDPFFMIYAFGMDTQLHIMAKIELFRIPGLSWAITKLGMYPVDRSILDFKAIRASLSYLKNGEKIALFP